MSPELGIDDENKLIVRAQDIPMGVIRTIT
jgi:hypothetical protein